MNKPYRRPPTEDENPNYHTPYTEEEPNPYLKQEGETYPEKMKRLNKTKKLLREQVNNEVGVKSQKLNDAFKKGSEG